MAPANSHRTATRRRWRPLVAVTAIVVALMVGPMAGVAAAHASVDSVSPPPGAVLDRSPRAVKVWFTEAVDVALGGMVLYDGNGDRVPTGTLRHPSPERLVLPIEGTLDDGSYIVTWRAVSEDTHPIQGTWTFHVGNASAAPSDVSTLANDLLAGQRADRAVAVGWGIARWAVFASIALLVGGAAFAAVIAPRSRDARATRRVVALGWIGLTAATVVGALLFGAYSRGGSLGDAFDVEVLRDTLGTRFGEVWLARLVLLAVALVPLRVLFGHRPRSAPLPRWWWPVAAVVAAGIVCTPGLAGHASTGDHRALALFSDGVHVAAMAVWLGGLVVLAAAVLRGRDPDAMRSPIVRFSAVSLACVGALIVTGAFQTWRVIGGLDALRDDEYGRILVIKLVVFALLLAIATFSREIVTRIFDREPADVVPVVRGAAIDVAPGSDVEEPGPDPSETRRELSRLRRSVWVEVAFGAAVLVVTALLVNTTPPVDATRAAEGATAVTIDDPRVTLSVTATPGSAGFNDLHVNTYSPQGTPLDVETLQMTLALPSRGLAPLAVPLRELGPGHYLSPGLDIPLAGPWTLEATIRLGPVDRVDVAGTLEIR